MNIGRAIQVLRKNRKERLSQGKLAQKVGLSQSYLSQIEKNRRKPSFKFTVRIAKAMNVSFGSLILHSLEPSDFKKNEKNIFLFELFTSKLE